MANGGDESKVPWFIRIAELPEGKYFEYNSNVKNNYFWNETLLGKMIPFNVATYYNISNNQESQTFKPGFTPLSIKEITYTDSQNDPLHLVYASPSFYNENAGPVTGVFVYEVNKNYNLQMTIDD